MSEAPPSRYHRITREIVSIPSRFPAPLIWLLLLGMAMMLLGLMAVSIGVLFARGPGIWGNNIPVGWGFPIISYVWWLGIAHAGTLISAMLLLVGQTWRNSLNRFAETMTIIAAMCAGMLPILHLGRPWYFYWMAPYPSTMTVGPQFRSPLSWDFFAVISYLLFSLCFWYVGLIPDLASARDRARSRRAQVFYGILAVGWRGSGRHWLRWRQLYHLLAAMAVPLVAMVTTSYAMLFAGGPLHGWNSTDFPPYFLAGAVFSGFAIVSILAVSLRSLLGLRDLILPRHLDMLGRMLLTTGLLTAFGYIAEIYIGFYAGGYERASLLDHFTGTYAWSYWCAVGFNFLPLQLMWSRTMRRSPAVLAMVGLCAAIGMWLERYMIVVSGLYRDWLESSTYRFQPTFWDWAMFAGFIGFFATAFLLFTRVLPVLSAFEIKEEVAESDG